jgi:hypothetical protein
MIDHLRHWTIIEQERIKSFFWNCQSTFGVLGFNLLSWIWIVGNIFGNLNYILSKHQFFDLIRNDAPVCEYQTNKNELIEFGSELLKRSKLESELSWLNSELLLSSDSGSPLFDDCFDHFSDFGRIASLWYSNSNTFRVIWKLNWWFWKQRIVWEFHLSFLKKNYIFSDSI